MVSWHATVWHELLPMIKHLIVLSGPRLAKVCIEVVRKEECKLLVRKPRVIQMWATEWASNFYSSNDIYFWYELYQKWLFQISFFAAQITSAVNDHSMGASNPNLACLQTRVSPVAWSLDASRSDHFSSAFELVFLPLIAGGNLLLRPIVSWAPQLE